MIRRAFWRFLFPGAVVILLTFAAQRWLPDSETVRAAWLLYPYLVLLVGCFYAFRFGRIRLLYYLALFVLLDHVLQLSYSGAGGRFFYLSAAVLVPLNFALISWMREKGLISKVGVARLIFFALQLGGVAFLKKFHLAAALAFLERDWFVIAHELAVPQTVAIAWALFALLLLVRALRSPGILEISLCWAYAVAGASLVWPEDSRLLLTTAGLITTLAVIEVTHFMAFRDELTGLPARRALTEYLAKLSGRYTLVMADVDHFKKVNDTHGHDIGDQVLRMVAGRMSRVAGGGRAFRYGGEEFTLVFAGKTLEKALPYVEKLREELANNHFTMRRPGRKRKKPKKQQRDSGTALQFRVTASFGMAQRDDSGTNAQAVIKRADEALYRAKKSGRNRVCR